MKLAARILDILLTDRTFERCDLRGGQGWSGRCIHCRSKLLVGSEGAPISDVTIEHIVPKTHGGTDDLENLALACARCNHQKGRRIDVLRATDPKYLAVVERLQAERRKRWRAPEDAPKPAWRRAASL